MRLYLIEVECLDKLHYDSYFKVINSNSLNVINFVDLNISDLSINLINSCQELRKSYYPILNNSDIDIINKYGRTVVYFSAIVNKFTLLFDIDHELSSWVKIIIRDVNIDNVIGKNEILK